MAQFPRQLVHHLLEDHRVHVLAEHVEQEPVADVGLLDNCVDDLAAYESEPDVEEVGAHLGAEDDDETVEDDQQGQHRQEDEPENKMVTIYNITSIMEIPF